MARPTRNQLAVLIFLAWTAVGVFEAIPGLLVNPDGLVFIDKLFDCWTWALLTPALLLIDRRVSRNQNIGKVAVLFLLLSVPISLIHTYLTGLFLYPIANIWWDPLRDSQFAVYYFMGGWAVYCAFVALCQAFRFHDRVRTGQLQLERVERRLAESRLNALRLHLEPHFLFNTLNAISSEVGDNPALARDMIGDLGALLRRSLDSKDSAEISLSQELAILDHYLSIQRVRFGDRISIKVKADPEMLSVRVPSMLLQPLVENAIRHGLEGRVSGGSISVSAVRAGDQVQIRVIDDGVGLPRGWRMESAAGHGIRVTRERLEALYAKHGNDCFMIRRRKGRGTEAVIHIPLRKDCANGN